VDAWLQEGVAAARAGRAAQARALLLRVIEIDKHNVQAWYWLSQVVESPQEREICLENVLALDPGHMAVQAELADLRRQQAEAEASVLLSKEALEAAIPLTAKEQLSADIAVEPLPCPYCGALIGADERQCLICARDLYIKEPKSKKHSIHSLGLVIGWFALASHTWLGLVVYYIFSGLASAADASPGSQSTLRMLGELLGFEDLGVGMLDLPLGPVLVAGGTILAFSLFVAWGLYRRIRFFYWLTVALILLYLLTIVYRVATAESVSLLGVVLQGGIFFWAIGFAFIAYDKFAWVERRLDAGLDRDVQSYSALYARGREYAKQGMWAKAACHWSKAVALSPEHPEYRTALASAYINLGLSEQALEHLHKVQQIEPHNPQVRELLLRISEIT
jgi:tetratricopeptide (TPR) repeat protein